MQSLHQVNKYYDIIIVGAGPAGCIAAKELSKKFSVLLIEASKLPRNKPCGGLLVKEAQKFLEDNNLLSKSFFSNPKYLPIRYEDWNSGNVNFVNKKLINIDRKKFDEFLFKQISLDEVDVLQNTRLLNFKQDSKIYATFFSQGSTRKIYCEKLIGCDGAASTVRRILNKKEPPCYVAVQEKIKHSLQEVKFIFDREITDYYAWIIPKDNNAVLGAALQHTPKIKFEKLKSKIRNKMKIKNFVDREAALILRPSSIDDVFLGNKKVLLAGEAAGLISPSSGEGISFALFSAKYLSKSLLKDFENPILLYKEYTSRLSKRIKDKFEKMEKLDSFRK